MVSADVGVLKSIGSKYIINETFTLLGRYAAYVDNCSLTFRHNLSV
jgi:hypothetical protein